MAAVHRGETGVLVGVIRGQVTTTPLAEVTGKQKPIDPELWRLAHVLTR